MLESDLENHQAQLSRFQLHVTSVTEDISRMESELNSTIMTLKRTLVSEAFCFFVFFPSISLCTTAWCNCCLIYISLIFFLPPFFASVCALSEWKN